MREVDPLRTDKELRCGYSTRYTISVEEEANSRLGSRLLYSDRAFSFEILIKQKVKSVRSTCRKLTISYILLLLRLLLLFIPLIPGLLIFCLSLRLGLGLDLPEYLYLARCFYSPERYWKLTLVAGISRIDRVFPGPRDPATNQGTRMIANYKLSYGLNCTVSLSTAYNPTYSLIYTYTYLRVHGKTSWL